MHLMKRLSSVYTLTRHRHIRTHPNAGLARLTIQFHENAENQDKMRSKFATLKRSKGSMLMVPPSSLLPFINISTSSAF